MWWSRRPPASWHTVLIGPPLAGKTTLLRALARSAGAEIVERQTDAVGSPPFSMRWLSLTLPEGHPAGRVYGTIPGNFWDAAAWSSTFAGADSAMLVIDPQRPRRDVNLEAIAHLALLPNVRRGSVVVTKQDFLPRCATVEELLPDVAPLVDRGWPVYRTCDGRPETLLRPFERWQRDCPRWMADWGWGRYSKAKEAGRVSVCFSLLDRGRY